MLKITNGNRRSHLTC